MKRSVENAPRFDSSNAATRRRVAHTASYFAAVAFREFQQSNGFTIQRNGTRAPRSGFAVSKRGGVVVETANVSETTLRKFAETHPLAPGECYGGWSYNGKTYLDVSRQFPTLRAALKFARENAQLCVWDCRRETAIHVDALSAVPA